MSPNTSSGDRICYNFNLKHGCKFAKVRQSCKRGRHLCIKCHGDHSLTSCKKSDNPEEWLPSQDLNSDARRLDLQMKCIDESCETLHTGDNDNHKFLHKLLDKRKRSQEVLSSKLPDASPKKKLRASSAFWHQMLIQHLYHLVLKVSLRGLAKTNFHDCYSSRFFAALVASLQMLRGIHSSVSTSCKSPVLKLDSVRPHQTGRSAAPLGGS